MAQKNNVRYYKCTKHHGKFIRLSDIKRKITAEELLLKLNSEVEKNPKGGKLSLKEKRELERQITDLAAALNRQQQATTDLDREIRRLKQENLSLSEQTELYRDRTNGTPANARARSVPIQNLSDKQLEKSIHMCFGYAHDLLRDINSLLDSEIREDVQERLDDHLHLMLMELINTHGTLENLGLVTKVEALTNLTHDEDVIEPVITNKARPPISSLFSSTGLENPKPYELREI